MKKTKRVAAMTGVILLVALYLLTLISAFFAKEYSGGLFLACLFSTFVIPVMIYAYMLIYRLVHKKDDVFSPQSMNQQDDKKSGNK